MPSTAPPVTESNGMEDFFASAPQDPVAASSGADKSAFDSYFDPFADSGAAEQKPAAAQS